MKTPRVTDHAILRYLERAKGVDVEAVRRHIEEICAGPMVAGATSVRAEGVKFCFAGAAVVTVTPSSQIPNKTQRERVQNKIQRQNSEVASCR